GRAVASRPPAGRVKRRSAAGLVPNCGPPFPSCPPVRAALVALGAAPAGERPSLSGDSFASTRGGRNTRLSASPVEVVQCAPAVAAAAGWRGIGHHRGAPTSTDPDLDCSRPDFGRNRGAHRSRRRINTGLWLVVRPGGFPVPRRDLQHAGGRGRN